MRGVRWLLEVGGSSHWGWPGLHPQGPRGVVHVAGLCMFPLQGHLVFLFVRREVAHLEGVLPQVPLPPLPGQGGEGGPAGRADKGGPLFRNGEDLSNYKALDSPERAIKDIALRSLEVPESVDKFLAVINDGNVVHIRTSYGVTYDIRAPGLEKRFEAQCRMKQGAPGGGLHLASCQRGRLDRGEPNLRRQVSSRSRCGIRAGQEQKAASARAGRGGQRAEL